MIIKATNIKTNNDSQYSTKSNSIVYNNVIWKQLSNSYVDGEDMKDSYVNNTDEDINYNNYNWRDNSVISTDMQVLHNQNDKLSNISCGNNIYNNSINTSPLIHNPYDISTYSDKKIKSNYQSPIQKILTPTKLYLNSSKPYTTQYTTPYIKPSYFIPHSIQLIMQKYLNDTPISSSIKIDK